MTLLLPDAPLVSLGPRIAAIIGAILAAIVPAN
jgi:hypothetical protein